MSDPAVRAAIVRRFKEIGFTYVSLDLEGYRTGSMNELDQEDGVIAPPRMREMDMLLQDYFEQAQCPDPECRPD